MKRQLEIVQARGGAGADKAPRRTKLSLSRGTALSHTDSYALTDQAKVEAEQPVGPCRQGGMERAVQASAATVAPRTLPLTHPAQPSLVSDAIGGLRDGDSGSGLEEPGASPLATLAHERGDALLGVEEIAETDEDEPQAPLVPQGSQHDEAEQDGAPVHRADACVAAEAAHACMLCGMDLSGHDLSSRQHHINSCLDRSRDDDGARTCALLPECDAGGPARLGPGSSQFTCAICGENMTWWSEEQRAVHMNWCCDAMLQAKAASASVGRDRHPRDVVPSGWPAEDDDTAFQPSKDRVGPGKEPTNMQDLDAAKRTGRSRCLGQVLQEMGLSKHLQVLQEAQVTDVGDLGRLTEGEMRQLGLSVGARKRLLARAAALRAEYDACNVVQAAAKDIAPAKPTSPGRDRDRHGSGLSADNEGSSSRLSGAAEDRSPIERRIPPGGGAGGQMLERRLQRVGQEIRDAVPGGGERIHGGRAAHRLGHAKDMASTGRHHAIGGRSVKGKQRQLVLTAAKGPGCAGTIGEDSSQLELALALSASMQGELPEPMRRRREAARSLAEVCLCGEPDEDEMQRLLLELIPAELHERERALQQPISLPPSRLLQATRVCGPGSTAGEKAGVEYGLWDIGALCAPENEDEVAVFYNGVLARKPWSEGCHVDVQDSRDEGRDGSHASDAVSALTAGSNKAGYGEGGAEGGATCGGPEDVEQHMLPRAPLLSPTDAELVPGGVQGTPGPRGCAADCQASGLSDKGEARVSEESRGMLSQLVQLMSDDDEDDPRQDDASYEAAAPHEGRLEDAKAVAACAGPAPSLLEESNQVPVAERHREREIMAMTVSDTNTDDVGSLAPQVLGVLREMSASTRAAARAGVERVIGATMEEFSASRMQIVSRAEEEVARVHLRVQHELELEEARHMARLQEAVVAVLRSVGDEKDGV